MGYAIALFLFFCFSILIKLARDNILAPLWYGGRHRHVHVDPFLSPHRETNTNRLSPAGASSGRSTYAK
jgi:hypothetical protein